jgi:hypothetical protein
MRARMSVDLPIWRAAVMSTTGRSARDRFTRCWRCRLSVVDILPSNGGFSRHFRTLLRLAQRQAPPSFRPYKRPALPRDAAGGRCHIHQVSTQTLILHQSNQNAVPVGLWEGRRAVRKTSARASAFAMGDYLLPNLLA